jgi:phosphonoacetate hydrolase
MPRPDPPARPVAGPRPRPVAQPADGLARWRDLAVEVLTAPELAAVVALVLWPVPGAVRVANAAGSCDVGPDGVVARSGRNPLEHTEPLAVADAAAEQADPHPPPERDSYPLPVERLSGLFADPSRSPDLVVVHTDGHFWPERGGHAGEHGSLSVRQSRAPLLLSGAGVSARGVLPRWARVVDVAPTLLHLLGVRAPGGLDGRALTELAASGADHVVGLLWDGANSTALLAAAAAGELPAVARLLDRGVALAGGAVAEFPSVTLVNHTSALTGVGPGRHGIVHNEFYDRALGARVLANDAATWHRACGLLRPGVATLWEMLPAEMAGACVNEPVDRGAGYSTFDLIRSSGREGGARSFRDQLPTAELDGHADQTWVGRDPAYAWSTQVDALGLAQVEQLWAQPEPPALTWWNTTLTDTGHHGGGAHSAEAMASLRDADRRLGVFLDLVEQRGLTDRTAVLLTADHGSVAADPGCRGDWDAALAAAGVPFRDEAYGFIYLGV